MADNLWQGGSHTDWTLVTDWSLGAVPLAADTVKLLEGSGTIVTNLPTTGLDHAGFEIGPEFTGALGSSAAKLQIGTTTAAIRFNGTKCKEAWFEADNGEAPSIDVIDTFASGLYPLVLLGNGNGAWTAVRVCGGKLVRIQTVPVTDLFIDTATAKVVIESGATPTNITMNGGSIDNSAAISGLLTMSGPSVFNHIATTAKTIALATLNYGAVMKFHSNGGTITAVHVHNGATLNLNGGVGSARTITDAYIYPGGTIDKRGVGNSVVIANEHNYGGRVIVGAVP